MQQVDDLRLDRDVEGGDRLVGDDEVGVHGQGAGDADALALAAGELVGVAVDVLGAQADALQELGHPRAARPRGEPWIASASPTMSSMVMRGLREE